ncbi:alkaline phosphatase D family protein [Pseudomonadota bacterium]
MTFAQVPGLKSGPMVGYAEMREVMLWIQTSDEAKVEIAYWEEGKKNLKSFTNAIITRKDDAYIAKLIADQVGPGRYYRYELYINDSLVNLPYKTKFKTLSLWRYRHEPTNFSLALGSCNYINDSRFDRPGKPWGDGYQIFNSILEKQPDLMVWMGDNFYLRDPDWNSWTGILHRYTHTRSVPELQPLLASVHHYASWDDHDYGPNNSDRGYWNKANTLKAFDLFWANPSTGVADIKGAISYFQWSDVHFFLLDNRYYRTPNRSLDLDKTILGKRQLQWLKDALLHKRGDYKVIAMGGQFLNDAAKYETYSNFGFDKERQEIIDFIYAENIRNVVFVSGDRHFSELSILKEEGRPRIMDLTVSPLTAAPFVSPNEKNSLRVAGTLVNQRNFAVMKFSGTYKNRRMDIYLYDSNGKPLWTRAFQREQKNK